MNGVNRFYVYNNNVIVPLNASFDIIAQMYRLTLEEYTYWDSWRRESGRYSCQKRVIEVYIATNTPHIVKLENNGYKEQDICREILDASYNYLDYATREINKEWISSKKDNYKDVYDRVEKEYVEGDIKEKGIDPVLVSIRNAY